MNGRYIELLREALGTLSRVEMELIQALFLSDEPMSLVEYADKKPSFVEDTRQGVAVEYVTCEPISDIFEEDTEEEDLIDSIDVSDEKQPEKKTV